jgi:hypothetical protein
MDTGDDVHINEGTADRGEKLRHAPGNDIHPISGDPVVRIDNRVKVSPHVLYNCVRAYTPLWYRDIVSIDATISEAEYIQVDLAGCSPCFREAIEYQDVVEGTTPHQVETQLQRVLGFWQRYYASHGKNMSAAVDIHFDWSLSGPCFCANLDNALGQCVSEDEQKGHCMLTAAKISPSHVENVFKRFLCGIQRCPRAPLRPMVFLTPAIRSDSSDIISLSTLLDNC